MVKEIEYINIREILSRVLRHKLLQDFNIEQAVSYTLEFIGLFGFPELYVDKEADIEIDEYMGDLPCGLIQIDHVKDCKTDYPLRKMTSAFNPGGKYYNHLKQEPQYKTQGRKIITTFPCGKIHIAYKGVPVDEEGMPLLVDNSKYMKALELYIKCQMFGDLFDEGKITDKVLAHTEQEYAWAAGQLSEEFKTPSPTEMQNITNMLNQIIVRNEEFYNNYERLGNREFRKIQRL